MNATSTSSVESGGPAICTARAPQAGRGVQAPRYVHRPLVAAIDGGGTKTLFLLAEADGTVIGVGRGGPLNALFVPPDEAIRSVRQAAVGALHEAGMGAPMWPCSMRALRSCAILWAPESLAGQANQA